MQIILAPMQGLTEVLFRRVFEECFPNVIDYAISPFLSLTHGVLKHVDRKIQDVLPEENRGSMPVVPQILGKEPKEFVELANYLYDLGYKEVNWNIGCPVRRVTVKHRGCGILPYPDEVNEVLSKIMPKLNGALSIKMRLGYMSNKEIFDIIPILNLYPIHNVTIHPRIGKQMYTGCADLDTFAKAVQQIKSEVIYNGDIVTLSDYYNIFRRFPLISKIMIGRGVLQNPPLVSQIKRAQLKSTAIQPHTPSQKQQVDYGEADTHGTRNLLLRLMEEIDRRLPSQEAKTRKTKEYWCLMFKAFRVSDEKMREVLHCTTFVDTRCAIENIIQ